MRGIVYDREHVGARAACRRIDRGRRSQPSTRGSSWRTATSTTKPRRSRRSTCFRWRKARRPFADELLETADFERAAEHFNTCRAQGLQGSSTDFLICAVAERRNLPILTSDIDFTRFAALLPITIHGRMSEPWNIWCGVDDCRVACHDRSGTISAARAEGAWVTCVSRQQRARSFATRSAHDHDSE